MKSIDEKYIDVLDRFGFGLDMTKTGCNLYHVTMTGTFLVNFNGEDFADMLIGYAETFDPNAYVSLQIKSHRSIKDIAEMLKATEEIQILLLRVALEFVKISKEGDCSAAKNA